MVLIRSVIFLSVSLPVIYSQYIQFSEDNDRKRCKNENDDLRLLVHKQNKIFESEVQILKKEVEGLRRESQELRDLMNKTLYQRKSASCTEEGLTFIGFTLTMASQVLAHKGSVLKSGEIITNYNADFNDLGEFLCCLNGTYVFFLHLVTKSTNANGAWIYKNDRPMTLVWQGGPTGTPGDASGTTSLVIDLEVGDTLSIRSYKDNLSVRSTSVWSGHLLSKLPNENPVLVATLKNPVAGNDVTIPGKEILVNLGHANYSLTKDDFLCTKVGLYKVDINSIMNSSNNNGVELYYNGKSLHSGLYRPVAWHSQADYSSSSTTAVLNLSPADRLSLKIKQQSERTLSTLSVFAVYFLKNRPGDTDFSCKKLVTIGTFLACPKSFNIFNLTGFLNIKTKGFYYFSIHLTSGTSENGVQIFTNNKRLTTAWLGADWGTWQTASTSVVVKLDIGDYVTFRKITSGLKVDHASIIAGYKIDTEKST
ncbi:uncharacterized protein LOC133176023 [Saccostrea echinata]|uniref:uncharacterized protein LOC133176023 n=1 Tax=Saccostrea echinata TaxID=191078 RepID=UPI002A7F5335|nr:uncharacterized protein LOC133176023 [Saccostrea echinata]